MKTRTVMFRGALILLLVCFPVCTAVADTVTIDFESDPLSGVYILRDSDGSATRSTLQSVSPTHSAKLDIFASEPTADPNVKVWYTGKLGNTAGSFRAYVDTAGNAPYMEFGVDVNGDGALTSFSTGFDALVIAFFSPTFTPDTWFLTGLDQNTEIHVIGNRPLLLPGEFSSSGHQAGDTLGALSARFTGVGTQKWGDLNVLAAYVDTQDVISSGNYTAFVDDINVAAVPTPQAAMGGLVLLSGLAVHGIIRKRRAALNVVRAEAQY